MVGISSLTTFLERTAPWRRPFREAEYGSLEEDREFLEEASPLNDASRIKAPLFIVHGANDPRVPVSEAEQIHKVLRANGVRSHLLVYPDEGHGLVRLDNRLMPTRRWSGSSVRCFGRTTLDSAGSNRSALG